MTLAGGHRDVLRADCSGGVCVCSDLASKDSFEISARVCLCC